MDYNPAVFIPNPSVSEEGYDIRTLMRRDVATGEIGLEIECEGNKFPKGAGFGHGHTIPKGWRYTPDGSLRGADNAEYVFEKPMMFEQVPELVHALYTRLSEFGTVLDESNRTSVHVHLNVQSFHLPRLTSFLALYFSIEELLTEWCGDHRVGNLFCLRAKDAPGIVTKIKKFIVSNGKTELTEGLHYSGMNAQALAKFGSLEIRSLRGVTDPNLLIQWVGVLERLYHLSADFKDPRSVTENFSGNDPLDYLRNILGDHYDVIRDGISMDDQQVRSSMYEGIRLAQDLCYCRDWSQYREADVSKNPFGRNSKKAAFGGILGGGVTMSYSDYLNQMTTEVVMPSAPSPTVNPFYPPTEPEEEPDNDYFEAYDESDEEF